MGVRYKGRQGQTKRTVELQEEECSYLSHLFLVSLVSGYVLLILDRSTLTLTVSSVKLMDSSCKKGESV
jgi:hypothetical protein